MAGLAALLVACGGGGGGSQQVGPTSNDGVPRIEPYERTAARSLLLTRSVSTEPTGPAVVPARVVLAPLTDLSADAAPRAAGQPVRIGQSRDIESTAQPLLLAGQWAWQPLATGGQAAAITFRSEGAEGLRLALRVNHLPTRAVLRIFGSEGGAVQVTGAEILASLSRDALPAVGASAREPVYWTPTVAGEEATLQLELPADLEADAVELAVPRLSHLWQTHAALRSARRQSIRTTADTCELDATCETAYSFEARSVARMEFVDDAGGSFYCSGTLVANTYGRDIPYFLTAEHCVNSQPEASSVITYWLFRSAACNNSTTLDPNAYELQGGGVLNYSSASSDVSFLQLNGLPPMGVVYAGSLVGQPAIEQTVGALHHPKGDWLKFSEGSVTAYASCTGTSCGPNLDAGGNFLELHWTRGVTEAGSSGSPVFATVGAKRYLVGHLFAGRSACPTPQDPNADKRPDYYGRFDRAYPSLKTWLGTVPGS